MGSAKAGAPSRAHFRLLRAFNEHVWERLFMPAIGGAEARHYENRRAKVRDFERRNIE